MGLTASQYARQVHQLLPQGKLWPTGTGSWLWKLCLAIADELARIDARAEELIREWSPDTATDADSLEDWERVLDLPDPYLLYPPATEAGRQIAAAARYTARGGSTPQYFVDLAASIGFIATVTDGVTPHTMTMNVDLSSYTGSVIDQEFEAGISCAGDDLGGRYVEELERFILRSIPAHVVCNFDYTP